MQSTPFVVGLAAGTLIASVLWWTFAADPAIAAGPKAPGQLAEPRTEVDASHRAEIDRLRSELARALALAGRSATDTEAEADGEDDPNITEAALAGHARVVEAVAPGDANLQLDELMRELRDLFTRGDLAKVFQDNPEQLVSFLMQAWLQSDTPQRALDLLRRYPDLINPAEYAEWIAWQLQANGDNAGAREASLMALQSGNASWDTLRNLAELDPTAALAALDALPLDPDADPTQRDAQRALLLLAGGDPETAWLAIDQLLEHGSLPLEMWTDLLSQDPAAAEQRLRNALQGADPGESQYLSARLVEALVSQDRRDDALAAATAHLQGNPLDQEVLQLLSDLDPDRAMAHLERIVNTNPNADTWAMYAEQLQQAGRSQEAIQAWWNAVDEQPGYAYQLLQADPVGSAPRLIEVAQRNDDDELFGDIADALWTAGNHSRATQLYRRANAIDPEDGEWTGKIRNIEAGRPPF